METNGVYDHDCRSRETQSPSRKPANDRAVAVRVSPLLPPPPAAKKPVFYNNRTIDYLSGDEYRADDSPLNKESTPFADPFSSSSYPTSSMTPTHVAGTSSPSFDRLPVYDKEPSPMNKSPESLPPAPWDTHSPSYYNQGPNFFEHQVVSHSNSGYSSSYNSLIGQTQNLSLNSSNLTKQEKPEDDLFKDLMDFGNSKTSSPSNPYRPF